MHKSSVKPIIFFLIALVIFSLLGVEFLVFFLSRLVDGRALSQLFSWPDNWYAAVFHWSVTIAIWAAGAWLCYRWAKRKKVLSDLLRFDITKRDGAILAIGIIFAGLFALLQSRFTGGVFPQIWREYRGFQQMYGQHAWVTSIFQNLYYLMEFVLVILLVALFQRTGELWFKLHWFPFGSIGLVLTWGSIHFVTNPQGAVWVMAWALVSGFIFVISRKSFFPVFLIAILGFII